MKKFIAFSAASLLAMAVAVPVSAGWFHVSKVKIDNNNFAAVTNQVGSNSDSGDNLIYDNGGDAAIDTGDAVAGSNSQLGVNDISVVVEKPMVSKVKIDNNNFAAVENKVNAGAYTGNNNIHGNWGSVTVPCCGISSVSGTAKIKTGNATAVSDSITVVNSVVTRVK